MSRDSKLPEKPLQNTPDTIEGESATVHSTHQQARGELAEAIAITEAIISKHQQVGPVDSKAIYAEVASIFETQATERTNEALADLTDRFHYFINGGGKALETELDYIEKNGQLTEDKKQWERDQLRRQYAEAKVMEKMAIVYVTDLLLHKFLNPYARFDDLVKLTNSTQNEAGQWSSEFDPNTIAPNTKRLISPQSVQEMRAGIQLALTMRQGVMELAQQHRGYDGRPNAKAIIAQVFGINITGRARVVAEGPLSISIVVTDEADYYAIYGENDPNKRSGGFHNRYLKTWLAEPRTYGNQYTTLPSDQRGLINLINGYERADTIDHENEHSLYEILVKNRGRKTDVVERLVDKAKINPGQSLNKSIEGAITELLFESQNRFIAGFANEVMAYVLNNESPNTPTDYIVDSVFRRLTESKLYSHHHLTAEVLERLKTDLLARSQALRKSASIDEQTATTLQAFEAEVEKSITKEKITQKLKNIITAVAELVKKYPNNKNYIRAMLAGTNPLQWSTVGDNIIRGYWKHDAQPRDAEEIKRQENWRLRKQLDIADILIPALAGNLPPKDQIPEQRSGDELYKLRPGEKLEGAQQFGDRTIFWIKYNDHRQLIDANGKIIFERDFYQSNSSAALNVAGKIVCGVELLLEKPRGRYSSRTKRVILKEDAPKPIGLEYSDIGAVGQWQDKIIFPARLANGFWCIVDENGKMLSGQFDDQPSIAFDREHYYVMGKKNHSYTIINDKGVPIGPQNLTPAAEPRLMLSSHSLIISVQHPKPKLIFTQTGKEITGSFIVAYDRHEKKFFKVKHSKDRNGEDYYFVDDQGNTIGANLPQPLEDVLLSNVDQFVCELRKNHQIQYYTADNQLLAEGENCSIIYTPDWKVAAFRQANDSGQSIIIDLSGQPLFAVSGFNDFIYYSDNGKQYFEGITADKKSALMDSAGQYIIEACDDIAAVANGLVYFKQGDQLKTAKLT